MFDRFIWLVCFYKNYLWITILMFCDFANYSLNIFFFCKLQPPYFNFDYYSSQVTGSVQNDRLISLFTFDFFYFICINWCGLIFNPSNHQPTHLPLKTPSPFRHCADIKDHHFYMLHCWGRYSYLFSSILYIN